MKLCKGRRFTMYMCADANDDKRMTDKNNLQQLLDCAFSSGNPCKRRRRCIPCSGQKKVTFEIINVTKEVEGTK